MCLSFYVFIKEHENTRRALNKKRKLGIIEIKKMEK